MPGRRAGAARPTVEGVARLWRLLPRRERSRLALGMALAALLAVLEALSVGLVPLFVLALQDPERVAALYARWSGAPWSHGTQALLPFVALALLLAYGAKTAFGVGVLAYQARLLREQTNSFT